MFTRRASGLTRELTWWDVFIFCIAGPAASGINFFSVNAIADYPGVDMGLAFVIGILCFLPLMVCLAMTTVAMPRSGSMYITISRVLGPTMGFFAGWMFFVGYGIVIGFLGCIVTSIIGSGFALVGHAAAMPSLLDLGGFLTSTNGAVAGGIIWTLIFWAVTRAGIKSVKWAMRIMFIIPFITTIAAVLVFLGVGPGGAPAAVDATWGVGTFQAVIDAAKAAGWSPPAFSMESTFTAFGYVVVWAYVAVEAISYAGGEIKTPKLSVVKGYVLGTLAVGIFYSIIAYSVHYALGQFIPAYDFLNDNAPDVLAEVMPGAPSPSVPFYAATLLGPKMLWLGLAIVVCAGLWFANSMLPVFLANSRLAFSMAMDRAFPEALADVDVKRGAPTWATHLTGFVGLFGVLVYLVPALSAMLGILNITTLFPFWLYGLAAMLLPYLKPDIYELSALKGRVAGIPAVSILGFFTFLVGMFFVIFSIMPFDMTIMMVMLLVMGIGYAIYLGQIAKCKRAGIDIERIYSVIPPE